MATAVVSQTHRAIRGQGSSTIRSPQSDDGATSHRMGYFDKYPARATPVKSANDDASIPFPPRAPASLNGHTAATHRQPRQRPSVPELQLGKESTKYEWPSRPSRSSHSPSPSHSRSSSPESSNPKPVNHSSSSSKSRARNSVASTLPELRYSASTIDRSSISPPHTPVGYHAPFPPDQVIVAAPTAGVEMMDALVDGMNGALGEHSSSDGNDYRHSSRSRRQRKHLTSIEKRHPGLHPHSTPPLPKPPRGVKLGTPSHRLENEEDEAGRTSSRVPRSPRPRVRSSTNADQPQPPRTPTDAKVRRGRSSSQLREKKQNTPAPDPPRSPNPSIDQIVKHIGSAGHEQVIPKSSRPSLAPSISDIIRAHAPELAKTRTGRPQRPSTSPNLTTAHEETEHDDPSSRSSIDSVTHEVQSTIQRTNRNGLHHARSFPNRPLACSPPTTYSGFRSVRMSESEYEVTLERPKYAQSVYSASSYGAEIHTSPSMFSFAQPQADSAMAIAQYIRSPKLTRLMTLRRPPQRGLRVSLADVGNPNGRPVIVFLGLGCVRYLIALYDEMAEALGLRLIAVDRWGMGRTDEVPQERRGLKEWAAVCEEVLDTLGIKEVGVLAHSAGAPYALAFALRMNQRVTGSIHLLAPWVGGGIDAAGYKWLKYVPNSFIKAAQNAEWKVHAWKLGKPPTIVYEGIGNDPRAPVAATVPTVPAKPSSGYVPLTAEALRGIEYPPPPKSPSKYEDDSHLGIPSTSTALPRTSLGGWSDYDDLADFEGKFGSQTTLATPPVPPLPEGVQAAPLGKRKASRGIFGILKGPPSPASHTPSPESSSTTVAVKNPPKLKGLRSISSLKGKLGGSKSSSASKPTTPKLDTDLDSIGAGLGIDVDFKPGKEDTTEESIEAWASAINSKEPGFSRPSSPLSVDSHTYPRSRRSISFTATALPSPSRTSPPSLAQRSNTVPNNRPLSGDSTSFSVSSHVHTTTPKVVMNAPTSSVATALLRASHKEAQKGVANDLFSILERDSKPWGFSYSDVKQKVKIWYGDKDEKIGEPGIRWMERVMKDCELTICKGRDHNLMTCSAVVVEALESLQSELRKDDW